MKWAVFWLQSFICTHIERTDCSSIYSRCHNVWIGAFWFRSFPHWGIVLCSISWCRQLFIKNFSIISMGLEVLVIPTLLTSSQSGYSVEFLWFTFTVVFSHNGLVSMNNCFGICEAVEVLYCLPDIFPF